MTKAVLLAGLTGLALLATPLAAQEPPGASRAAAGAVPSEWRREAPAHVLRHLRFPEEERRSGRSGTALLRIVVGADGHVRDVVLIRSAGRPAFDAAALAAVRAADPLPAPGWLEPGGSVVVSLPVQFKAR